MENTSLPKVLFIEDNADQLRRYAEALEGVVEFISARTIEEGRQKFAKYADELALIVLDGCLNTTDDFDGYILSREFRQEGFKNPIIAASSNEDLNKDLMRNGCSHNARNKNRVGGLVEHLLEARLAPAPPLSSPHGAGQKLQP